jgi:hypothetical protein
LKDAGVLHVTGQSVGVIWQIESLLRQGGAGSTIGFRNSLIYEAVRVKRMRKNGMNQFLIQGVH